MKSLSLIPLIHLIAAGQALQQGSGSSSVLNTSSYRKSKTKARAEEPELFLTPIKSNEIVPLFPNINFINRYLRGGSTTGGGSGRGGWSGGRRGGGSGGGNRWSSHNSNNRWNRNNSQKRSWWSHASPMKRFFAIGVFGLTLLFLLLPGLGIGAAAGGCFTCLAGLCCGATTMAALFGASSGNNHNDYYSYNESNNEAPTQKNEYHNDQFNQMVSQTKQEMKRYSTNYNNFTTSSPYSGTYNSSFIDTSDPTSTYHNAKLELYFTLLGNDASSRGYSISGQVQDADGTSIIEEGFVTLDGSQAWWRERIIQDQHNSGLQVLSKGRFDFQQHTFHGTWFSNTLHHGSYISFMPHEQQTNNTGIPIATPVTFNGVPLVSAPAPNDKK